MADIQVANTDADLSGNTVVTEENAYTITGLHTFSRSTNAPFACISGAAVVTYLDADKLDGQEGTYYLAAANITGTTLASNVVTSSLTAVGTIATGVWQGTDVGVAYGGTGVSTLTDGGVLLGQGTGNIEAMAVLADGEMIVGDGATDPVAESGATLRTSIGVGTGDSPTFTAVTVGQVDITAEGDLRLQDNTGGEYVGLDAPSAVSGSYTLTFPAAIGAVDQVLSISNTDGTLQWATPDSGDITSVVAGAGMTGGGTSGAVTLNVIGTADKVTVSADAVTIASTYIGQTSITTLGTVGTGTWQGTAVADTYVADALTISGGTVNNSVIGGSTAAAGTFTQVDVTGEGDLRLQDNTGGQYVGLDAPATVSGSYTLTLPAAIGSVDQALTINNVDGTLQWATPSSFNPDGAQVFNDSGAAVDFRIEADDEANMFFLDGSEDRIGIATSTPGAALDIAHGTGAQPLTSGDTASNTGLRIGNTGSNNTVMDIGADSATNTSWIQSRNRGNLATSYAYPILLNPNGGGVTIAGTSTTGSSLTLNQQAASNGNQLMFATYPGQGTSRAFSFGTAAYAWGTFDLQGSNGNDNTMDVRYMSVNETATTFYFNVAVSGSLSKGSGSFNIQHPLPSKADTHRLVHSFAESPETLLIYRGTIALVDGTADVDLDDAAGMTTGTWVLLCRDEQCFTSNETGWHHVRGSVTGSTLTIDCEEVCDDTVAWMVVANRKDTHIMETDWTDEEGYPIVEPLKPEPEEPEP